MPELPKDKSVIVIGAGPAGLTASYLLAKAGVPVVVLEADPELVGGISRTVNYRGFGFDIGGHRFFSKSQEVEALWTELLPDDMLTRPRSSRIYYGGKFFSYPLKPAEAFFNLGPVESIHCALSYFRAALFPNPDPKNFEEWVTNKFGARLFGIFFKTYTEKVWGMSTRDISADWAAQRIKGLSLSSAILSAFRRKPSSRDKVIKTLINSFRYPRRGPGMLWEAAARRTRELGGRVLPGRRAVALDRDAATGQWRVTSRLADGSTETHRAAHVITSAPLRELISVITPPLGTAARAEAAALHYRDFLTVALIVKDRGRFDDNWIYIHDPSVKVGRIQNFKSWSPELVPNPALNCYGLEYFCFEGDGLWNTTDAGLIELATTELIKIGLASREDIVDGCVVRQPKAYPVYDSTYKANVATLREELTRNCPGLHPVGRNGMHKYNNQDHAMMTSMLCVKNIIAGETLFDPWEVNEDAEYHEAGESKERGESGLRQVPVALPAKS